MSRDEPRILIYATRDAGAYRDLLVESDVPGTIEVASNREEAERKVGDAEVLIAWRFPADLFHRATNLRWVQSLGAGIEDLLAADLPPDVTITRVVGLFGAPIAEYVFAQLLFRTQRLAELQSHQARHEWGHIEGELLAGRTMGIAGLGSIGGAIAQRARAFQMQVYGLSRTGEHAGLVDRHFRPDEWQQFVSDLDVLVLILPLTTETERVVDRSVLEAMPARSILINVGRGKVVDGDALVEALRAGGIAGAILDVFEREPLPPESPLWSLPNVTITPHISGPSLVPSVGKLCVENVRRYVRGEPLLGVVNRAAGY